MKPCPCHSNIPYDLCCKPFHEGKPPQTALELMRSRYSAYALRLVDYIIATTHPDLHEDLPSWKKDISHFCLRTSFLGLKIPEEKQEDLTATVTFTAYLSQKGKDVSFTEKSSFVKQEGKWFYAKGEVVS